ncbi:EAL domain-containing protein [Paraburkholderia caribensis]|uniref:EAL domain-containing protein n=1 Tax=Paraburkholderia caribensis TaxID=75105 RepID=UPI00286028D0|nr:EAL domain-containing protein [Paraburkholderia caribensis]MDR6380261.1 EAL domain-containing protein (putative c-di-GMP-specific phosphodiesterase class I) [Paraburkholderia caribensis]
MSRSTSTGSGAAPRPVHRRWGDMLRADALRMHYQPLLDLRTGRVTKVEALARLRDGDALIAPGQFLPSLCGDGHLELYRRGLAQVLTQRNAWRRIGIDVVASVNLPPAALGDPRYFDATRAAFREFGCAPGELMLEVLESGALPCGVELDAQIASYKTLGVELAQDDLGTGHSSLSRLRELPFDCVKIDRSIADLQDHDAADVLPFLHHLTRLGQALGKAVVVEGVEDPALLDALRIFGVDLAQGYGIARPMPGEQFPEWIAQAHFEPRRAARASRCARLAYLMVWEERMLADAHLRTQGAAGHPGAKGDIDAWLAGDGPSAQARDGLLDAARDSGVHSGAYRAARQRLIATM